MKVLFFSHQAEFIYGGEICTLALMEGLQKSGVEVFFASPPGPYQERAKNFARCFTVSSLQFSRDIKILPRFFPALLKTRKALRTIIQNEQIDILHTTSLKAMVYAHGIKTCPVVWHHHDILPKSRANQLWLRWIASRAQKILCPSQAGVDALFLAGVPKQKLQLLYNGFSLAAWPYTPRKELSPKIRLAFLGEISERKGSDWIYPILTNLGALPFTATVIGEGLSDPAFAEKIKKENGSLVEKGVLQFLGRRNDVRELLQQVDLLLVPSRQDPLPTVIIEAFLSAVPVLGSPVGGIPEMVENGKNGFLCKTPAEFSEQILALAKSPEQFLALSVNARKSAEEKFSLDKTLTELLAVYHTLLSQAKL